MKRVLKSFCTIGLALPVVFSLMGMTSFAATGGGSELECDILEEGQADVIAEQLEKSITNKYLGYYTFDNFRPTFYNEQYADGVYMVDVDISVDKTLVRDPEESAIARGMKQEVEAQIQARQRDTAQAVLDEYLSNTSKYLNVPVETGFEFRVYIAALTEEEVNNATDFECFYRVDAEDGPILTPVIENEPFVELGTEEDGKARLVSEMSAVESRAVSYDADAAVKYAIDNATATPEFSSANGLGNDCANFVSKCINAGGIPIDNAGKWYPAPKKGSYASEKADNVIIPLQSDNTADDFDSNYDRYEYYLTKKELIMDIEQGYIFRLDTAFKKPCAPFVTQGDWSFYVHEENIVNLEISFSNLLLKPKESIFPMGEQVIVEMISPEGESLYCFEKVGDEIIKDTSIQEQISVTEGEWTLRISFGYYCGNTPACLKIAAVYENPTEDDINWLKEERLANKT